MADNACPPFGTGSIDLNAVHKASLKSGADLADAIAKATTVAEAPSSAGEAPAAEAPAPEATPVAEAPASAG